MAADLCEYRLARGGTSYDDGQVRPEGTVAPGTSFCRFEADGHVDTRKMEMFK